MSILLWALLVALVLVLVLIALMERAPRDRKANAAYLATQALHARKFPRQGYGA